MKILERPDVDLVSGLAPTVAIEQRISHAGRRSTVATLTETYHFLRLLYSKLGTAALPRLRPAAGRARPRPPSWTRSARRFGRHAGQCCWRLKVLGRKGFHKEVLERAAEEGLHRGAHRRHAAPADHRRHGALAATTSTPSSSSSDSLPARDLGRRSSRRGLEEGGGHISVLDDRGREEVFSLHGICPACGIGTGAARPAPVLLQQPAGRLPGLQRAWACVVAEEEDEDAAEPPSAAACGGSRLKPQALAVQDRRPFHLGPGAAARRRRCGTSIRGLQLPGSTRSPWPSPWSPRSWPAWRCSNRLGLSYLSLGRSGNTLSGGEAQRVRLAAQLGSNLTGVCYILDEPTIGLHPRDNHVLVEALKALRDRGNTIVVVEHDEETIRAADTHHRPRPRAPAATAARWWPRAPGRRPARAAVGDRRA
ncbi:MAG: hypothetical protein MZV70_55655 [Desulfobacterales bacterium]|nr:hypothetical protein [Desulfobacterales bacterium]